jgi:predicted site-specific integrase-resolvase
MKLADWARAQGIDYKTAYRWFRAGILPVPSRQLPTGTILVNDPAPVAMEVVSLRLEIAKLKRQVRKYKAASK